MDIIDSDIEAFILACDGKRTLEDLFKVAADEFKNIGFSRHAYHYFPHMGSIEYKTPKTILSNNCKLNEGLREPISQYLQTYGRRLDPIEEYCLKTGEPVSTQGTQIIESYNSESLQSFLKCLRQEFGHAIVMPVFGPRHSRGCMFLFFEDKYQTLSRRSWCYLEYMCFHFHRIICKILASRGKVLKITPREHEVLQLIPLGLSNREIASILGISQNTVNGYLKSLFLKLEAPDRITASLRAFTLDLID